MTDISRRLADAAMAFVTPLRLGEGFDEDRFRELLDSIRALHSEWETRDVLPKSAVLVLVDLPRLIEACSVFYRSSDRQKIIDASMTTVDVILEGF